jgi:hypothetical protein
MSKPYFIFLMIIVFTGASAIEAQNLSISGKIIDKETGKTISNCAIFLNPGNQVATTDQEGVYRFLTSPGKKQITSRVMGYRPASIRFEAYSDSTIDIYLQVSPFELNEVTITGDSVKSLEVTRVGSFVLTPAALRETPRLFSEPDLLKSFQLLPGVVAGKDGTSDIYVRGGGTGQNIILANGCYFFLPGHLLGIISPYDLDFLESAELFKDYFPAELGGGASSVINLDFRKPHSDSLKAQLRLGLLSSGITVDLPLKKIGWDLTAGLRRGNYSLYSTLLKKIIDSDVGAFLPPDKYNFYDGFLRLSRSSPKWGNISYLFFGNYDNGKEENKTTSRSVDTLINYTDGMSTGWNNMVHALQWDLPVKNSLRWKFNLNYNRLSMGRNIFSETERSVNGSRFDHQRTANSFSPVINSSGSSVTVGKNDERISWSAGISARVRSFDPNTISTNVHNDTLNRHNFGESSTIFEPALFVSSTIFLTDLLQLNAGMRLSSGFTRDAYFAVPEPRLRLAYDPEGVISPHINYVRLSQFDHSVEGSNAGLRTMLWLPVSKEFGPEVSDVFSAGFQGEISKNFIWTLDGYYKRTSGMIDFKPGASFIFDTSFVDILDKVKGRAYGLEAGIVKRTGNITGSASYTYSRSKREWFAPEGLMWIPSGADRPHNLIIALKYYYKHRTSFGLNFIYQSGAPATIYMHDTSYGEFFETKNNIRYFDYHRLDLSIRHMIYKRKFTIFLDADIYNVYNHKNTFYFKKTFDEKENVYYFRNISLFPVMPSLTITIKY